MNAPGAEELFRALRSTLGPRWEHRTDEACLVVEHRNAGTPYRPPRRSWDWTDLISSLEKSFAGVGVRRSPTLPLRWGRDTDLVISAVQAMDPYIKDQKPFVYREGFLPQPVVRFTGKRDRRGQLCDGFLTSFVNVSHVRRVQSPAEIASMLDQWLTVISRLGLHARHVGIRASPITWRRPPVAGITLHYRHAGIPLGDLVWIWNQADPAYMVGDLGSGLERIAWAITRCRWSDLIYGDLAKYADPNALDAIRTSTLLIGSGVRPSGGDASTALRRVLRRVPPQAAALGLDTAVSTFHRYWQDVTTLGPPGAEISRQLCLAIRHAA